MRVTMTFDDKEWQKLVDTWKAPEVRKVLEAGAATFGEKTTPLIRAATPSAKPGNKYAGSAGNLRRQTRWRLIAARFGVGVVVAAMGKTAFYRRFVTGGTLPHSLAKRGTAAFGAKPVTILGRTYSGIDHPGSRPNDYIGRIADRAEKIGFDAADKVILDGLDGALVRSIPPR